MGLITVACSTPEPGPYPKGRRCAEPDCATILHTRHDGDRCYLHAPPEEATPREQRTSLEDLMMDVAA
jgi:hypothetical protein